MGRTDHIEIKNNQTNKGKNRKKDDKKGLLQQERIQTLREYMKH